MACAYAARIVSSNTLAHSTNGIDTTAAVLDALREIGVAAGTEFTLRLVAENAAISRAAESAVRLTFPIGALDLRGFAAQNHASLCTTDPRDAVRWLELHAMVERCKS